MSSNVLTANCPILTGKNWNQWSVKIKAIMGFQEVLDVVENGFTIPEEGSSAAAMAKHKEDKKNDFKAICLLHQSVDEAHFEKISVAKSSREAWQILEKCNDGADKMKKMRLNTLKRQYELMQMETGERISAFFNKIVTLTNSMKACGEVMTELSIIEKVLRTLTPNFDYVVVAIEEARKLESLTVDDLQCSLEAHEHRILERSSNRPADQALQAETFKKGGLQARGGYKGRGTNKEQKGGNSKSY